MPKLKTVPNGLLVFFEGIDGVGKTTQLELLAERLQKDGWLVQHSRSHGGTPIGEALREVSLSHIERPVATDFYVSLAMHIALLAQVRAWRAEGAIILIDRGPLSLVAYQIYGDGLSEKAAWPIVENDFRAFAPELVITYSAPVETALKRAKAHKAATADYFENKPAGYFERVQEGYLEASKRFQAKVIDANRSLDKVQADTLKAVQSVLTHIARNKAPIANEKPRTPPR